MNQPQYRSHHFAFAGLLLAFSATAGTAAAQAVEARPAAELPAGHCCLAPHAAPAWMFHSPLRPAPLRLPGLSFSRGRHLRFGPMLRSLGEGVADRPSGAKRARGSALALPGFGASYGLTSHLRATTGWDRGIGPYSLAPGSHFTVGVALRY